MSIVADFFSLAGPTPTPAASGERADASGFAGMLDAAGARPRGLLGLGRRLAEQTQAETARVDDNGPLIGGDPLILPGLLTSPVKPAEPEINPGPGGESPATQPPINPGVVTGKADQPLVRPDLDLGPEIALVRPDQADPHPPLTKAGEIGVGQVAQIQPGEAPAPGLPDGVLDALAQTGQVVRADATAAAARQAVGRAPEISTVPQSPEAAIADLEVEALDLEAATAPAAPAPAAASGGSTPGGGVQSGPVEPAGVRAEAERVVADTTAVTDGDDGLALAEAALPQGAAEMEAPVGARVDSAPMPRLAADAIAHISAQIIRRLEGRATRFDIELNPVELGKVEVRLDIDAEGRLAARLAFDNPAAAAEMRGRVDELRRDLEQAGFQLSEDAFSFADREGAREGRDGPADGSLRSFARSAEASDEADLAAQPALRALTRMGLDVRV